MTNKEILQADMLDILFEHRNKLYGAYALRKYYSKRLGIALSVSLSTVMLFMLMSFMNKRKNGSDYIRGADSVKITNVIIPEDKPKEPDPPKDKPKPTAQVDYQQYKIVPNDQVIQDLPDINAIDSSDISNINIDGRRTTDIAGEKINSNGKGDGEKKQDVQQEEPSQPSREPSFPGGPSAWLSFLQKYLQAPADIEPGQRIEVQVRFWIDVDGSISRPEIVKSGGASFDKEVLRVLKKMPKWEPALQAGRPIAVAYQQPVIFIGQEE